MKQRPAPERRASTRPSNGDTAVCPKCGSSVEFNERYRLPSRDGGTASTPAWVCDGPGCGYIRVARAGDDSLLSSARLRKTSLELRVVSSRRLTKAARVGRRQAAPPPPKTLQRKKH